MKKGDLVVATKYSDGETNDHFVVGFFRDMTWHNRYNIVDESDKLFRHNGFRKAKNISKEVGSKILDNIKLIENSDKSVWDFVSQYENEK
jgi:hypothetical protein